MLRATLLVAAALLPTVTGAAPALLDERAAVAQVFVLVADRLELMPQVAAAKWTAGVPVQDPQREQAVFDRAAAAASATGLEPRAAHAWFVLQAELARATQQTLHNAWQHEGCSACATAPALSQLRTRLDALTTTQVRAVYLAAPALAQADSSAHYAALADETLSGRIDSAQERARMLDAVSAMRLQQPPGLPRVRASGVLRIAVTGDYAPFSLEARGEVRGADIELGLQLASALGVEPVFVHTTWASLLQDLAADRFDVAMGGVSVTPDRLAAGAFTRAYQRGGKTIVARCAERERFDTLAELDTAGVRLIVNPGGTNERYVRANLHHAAILMHPDNRTVFREILAGRADAMITDDVEAELQARREPLLCRTLPGTLTQADKAIFMVRDAALNTAVDEWLAQQLAAGVPARLLEQAMAE